MLNGLRRESASIRALIKSAVSKEVEKDTYPSKGLLKISIEYVVKSPCVISILTAVMLQAFPGLVERLDNAAMGNNMPKQLENGYISRRYG